METKKLYIIMSQTGTLLSRFIKLCSKAEYNHASISLAADLKTMYSFGRLNPYNPFVGGFVEESPERGTFKRFSKTRVLVVAVDVTVEQYEAIYKEIQRMLDSRRLYRYNYIGLGLAAFGIYYAKRDCYYCSEFVKEILNQFEVPGSETLDNIVHPIEFLNLPDAQQVYCGTLTEYTYEF